MKRELIIKSNKEFVKEVKKLIKGIDVNYFKGNKERRPLDSEMIKLVCGLSSFTEKHNISPENIRLFHDKLRNYWINNESTEIYPSFPKYVTSPINKLIFNVYDAFILLAYYAWAIADVIDIGLIMEDKNINNIYTLLIYINEYHYNKKDYSYSIVFKGKKKTIYYDIKNKYLSLYENSNGFNEYINTYNKNGLKGKKLIDISYYFYDKDKEISLEMK